MPAAGEFLVGLVMVVGVVGVLVPVLPGLALVWGAGLVWVWLDGAGAARVTVGVLLTGLLAMGTVARFALPARHIGGARAPRSTLLLGALGATVGFFLIPVVGLVVGGVGAVFLAELARLRHPRPAWEATVVVLRAVGIGLLVELATAVLMLGTWLAGVALT